MNNTKQPVSSIVYIVDDDVEWCTSLKWLLESMHLKAEIYQDPRAFLKIYNPQWLGCILIDIRMPGMSGLQVQEQLNDLGNQMPVIIISGHADVPLAVRAMKAGAFDMITKPINEEQLLEQIYKAIEQDKRRQHTGLNHAKVAERYAALTMREREVVHYILQGKLNKQIAAELNLSIKTVESHRSHVMQKLQIRTLADLFKISALLKLDKQDLAVN